MGLFDRFKRDTNVPTEDNLSTPTQTQENKKVVLIPDEPPTPVEPTGGLLDLSKNQILDLSKVTKELSKLRVAAGWDVNTRGASYDLDVAAYLLDSSGRLLETVYYGEKNHKGISLDGDNLTGEGDGDDETITVDLTKVNPSAAKIVFAVVIFKGQSKRQTFGSVKNAFTRVIDDSQGGKELCRFSLTDDGGQNTAVVTAELIKNGPNDWSFRSIGTYSEDSIESLGRKL